MAALVGQKLTADASIIIDGEQYIVPAGETITRETVPTQPGDAAAGFERRIFNLGLGWGWSRYEGPGTYDYAAYGNLHRPMAFLPGSTITDRTNGTTAPNGGVTFEEFWSTTSADRRLIVVSPRYVYEIDSAGSQTVFTPLDANQGSTVRGMTRAVRYRNANVAAAGGIWIARGSITATDYFVERQTGPTYAITSANKVAMAFGVGKDVDGEDVLWRVAEDGKLYQSVAGEDPDTSGSWAAAGYPVGETTVRAHDMSLQARAMLVGKADGFWTFDMIGQSFPITEGLAATPDTDNARYMKNYGSLMVAPHIQGLVWIDGLEWDTCGPVSSNDRARNLRGREVAVSDQAGRFVYCAVYQGTTSYIFLGTPWQGGQSGRWPIAWHGPIASIAQRVTDLKISTVYGRKLWIGWRNSGNTAGGYGTIELNEDFSPVPDLSSGEILLPSGILDMDGPGVIKDLEKVEFVAPSGTPFSSTNAWGFSVNVDNGGWNAVDGGNVTSGQVGDRYFTTERSGKRIAGKITYANNSGAAELEQIIVRGTVRPETTDMWTFPIRLADAPRTPGRARMHTTAIGTEATLRALVDDGRNAVVAYGEHSFTGRVVAEKASDERGGLRRSPEGVAQILVRRVKLA